MRRSFTFVWIYSDGKTVYLLLSMMNTSSSGTEPDTERDSVWWSSASCLFLLQSHRTPPTWKSLGWIRRAARCSEETRSSCSVTKSRKVNTFRSGSATCTSVTQSSSCTRSESWSRYRFINTLRLCCTLQTTSRSGSTRRTMKEAGRRSETFHQPTFTNR